MGKNVTDRVLLPVFHVESPESDVAQVEVAADAVAADHVVDDDVHLRAGRGLGLVVAILRFGVDRHPGAGGGQHGPARGARVRHRRRR